MGITYKTKKVQAQPMHMHVSYDATGLDSSATFTITHPYHPLNGETFQIDSVLKRRSGTFLHFATTDGEHKSVDATWTDWTEHPEVTLQTEHSSRFSYESLVELAEILKVQKQ